MSALPDTLQRLLEAANERGLTAAECTEWETALAQVERLTGHAPSTVGIDVTDCTGILKGNADLQLPEHNAHVRAMEAREAVRRG